MPNNLYKFNGIHNSRSILCTLQLLMCGLIKKCKVLVSN